MTEMDLRPIMQEHDPIKLYICQPMTGLYCDEILAIAEMLQRVCNNYGFVLLSPIFRERIPRVHELLTPASKAELLSNWKGDKTMIKDADVVVDFMGLGKSNGVNNEICYARYGLWKPVVHVWPNMPLNISQLEGDAHCESLIEAMELITHDWGTFAKLGNWRQAILARSFLPWLQEQHKINGRYGIRSNLGIMQ